MPWGAGEGLRLTTEHAGSGMVLTALLLGEAANIPGCRGDGGWGQGKVAVLLRE